MAMETESTFLLALKNTERENDTELKIIPESVFLTSTSNAYNFILKLLL